MPATIETDTN